LVKVAEKGRKERLAMIILLGTFLTWEAGDTTEMLGYVSDLITDLTPLLVPIIAVGVGLIIVSAIISAIRGHR